MFPALSAGHPPARGDVGLMTSKAVSPDQHLVTGGGRV